ncbi:MAG: flagellar protein FliT [Thermacetogeniaceae bacterium]|jgi:flagellar biosynthesis/type III secretory pathway chaperone
MMSNAVWQEALKLTQSLEEITGLMKDKLDAGEVEAFLSLLDQRQKIIEQLDQLKNESGIASWIDVADKEVSQEIQKISQEIANTFRHLLQEDQRIKNILEEKRSTVLKKLGEVRRSQRVHETYERGGICGAFIDSRG